MDMEQIKLLCKDATIEVMDIPLRRSRHSGVMDTASPEQRTAKLLVDSVSLLA